jgi:uncharacterized repeat protein (TIGR03843 family)
VYGVDHGVTFHAQDKLRTVLWQWAGERLTDQTTDELTALRAELAGPLGEQLRALLTGREVTAVRRRIDGLLRTGRYPEPSGNWPPVPWPPF